MNISPKYKGILLTFASAAFLSVTFVASKQALLELTPLAFTPIWFGFASIWGVSYYALQADKVNWLDIKPYLGPLVLLGLSSAAANLFFFTSVRMGDPTVVAFFSRSETIFSLLLGIIVLHEAMNGKQWLGVAIALLGVAIMTYQGGKLVFSVLILTLIAGFFNALTSFIAKRNVSNVPPIILGIGRTVVLTMTFGLLSAVSGNLTVPTTKTILWMAGGSFFGPFLSFFLFYKGLVTVNISTAAIIRATQPLFVAVYGFVLFGTLIGPVQFLGGLILLSGVVMMLANRPAKQRSSMSNPLIFWRQKNNHNLETQAETVAKEARPALANEDK